MELGALIAGLDARPHWVEGGADPRRLRICDLTDDSRTALPGSLFIARGGGRADGRRFIPDAIALGAVAVLAEGEETELPDAARAAVSRSGAVLVTCGNLPLITARLAERFYGAPSSRLRLIGVTGTNGKTTTTFLVHQMLDRASDRCGLIGTVCVDDGCEVAPAALTTPPATELSRTLARMIESGCTACAMEVSSHALHQERVGGLRFGVGVFTNLTRDHLDYHGDMARYAQAKAMLFERLEPGALAIVNADDPAHTRMIRDCPAEIWTCSLGPGSDATCRAQAGAGGVQFTGPWGAFTAPFPLVGEFNLMNGLQAVAAAHRVGSERLNREALAGLVPSLTAPPGRLQPVTDVGAALSVYVDYAHTDDALRRALSTLRASLRGDYGTRSRGRLWCVFGCGGDRDRTKRPLMGAAAVELADRVVVTSDNPRTESPHSIIEEILAGVPADRRGGVRIQPERETAIRDAIGAAGPGDVVLIAGKGHEDYQILPDGHGGTVRRHFDDREVACRVLAERGIQVRPEATIHSPRSTRRKPAKS
ncbi:MAG: UDP-N-acetylmuramoyl-L-alanyl-D-glutamate--2,6-diaminopimelate ligase [Phycisphaerae bacterium]|nr:UDP-N-acetylmuramoyl-L-alanyl-D-glutamate--2,6-diaminopimelate ligase [Phycisphaerae bacterium]